MKNLDTIQAVDLRTADMSAYRVHVADCVIVTKDRKLLLQQRPINWKNAAGCLTTFGGHIEEGETIHDGLIRELKEELGAEVRQEDLISLGGVTEDWTQHKELVHLYFWHDRQGTITGCYEAETRYYKSIEEALLHPKIMDYVKWALDRAKSLGLLEL